MKSPKKNKKHIISARYTDDEYADVMLKISNRDGEQVISVGEFSKLATLSKSAVIVDSEVERYKVYIASKISNNINQIAKRLNTDNRQGIIGDKTYSDVLYSLNEIRQQLVVLLSPVQ